MRYDLIPMIFGKLGKDKMPALNTAEYDMIRDIHNSAFPELDGLKINEAKTTELAKQPNRIQLTIHLLNRNNEEVEIYVIRAGNLDSVCVDNKLTEFEIIYTHNNDDNKTIVNHMEFTRDNDNIVALKDFDSGYNLYLYTNTVGSGEVYRKGIKKVLPDYYCKLSEPRKGVNGRQEGYFGWSTQIDVKDASKDFPEMRMDPVNLEERTKANTLARTLRFVSEYVDDQFHEKYLCDRGQSRK